MTAAAEAAHDEPAHSEAVAQDEHDVASSPSTEVDVAEGAPQPASEAAEVAEASEEPAAEPHDVGVHDAQPASTLVWDDEPRTVADAPAPTPNTEFPLDAIAALDSLDMPLPPRATEEGEAGAEVLGSDAPHDATNGLAHPAPTNEGRIAFSPAFDLTAMQDDDELPPLDAAEHEDAEPAQLSLTPPPAPLGGAQFGALNLDFDLDLPASPSAALPALSPETLAKIAHNKLDLASEYVELGDLAGARTLLQEVVEAGHAGTADEARVRLAKLAELS